MKQQRKKNGIRIKVEVMREAVRVREKESNVGGMRIQNKDGKKEFGSKYGIH